MRLTIYTFLFALLFATTLFSQHTVYPIIVGQRPNEFQEEQYRLWKQVTEKEPSNKGAWWNLESAVRHKDFPAIFQGEEYRKEVTALVTVMGHAMPDSYQYHWILPFTRALARTTWTTC